MNNGVLTLAARATASFPGVFSPVSEHDLLSHRVLPKISTGASSGLIDGGVLNNAPFGPVLDEIAIRRIDEQPVERVIVYIVPSVAQRDLKKIDTRDYPELPTFTVALKGILQPREVDLRTGTEELDKKLQSSVRKNRQELFYTLSNMDTYTFKPDLRSFAADLLPVYLKNRARAILTSDIGTWLRPEPVKGLVTPTHVDERVVEDVLHEDRKWLPHIKYLEPCTKRIDPGFRDWRWGTVTAERVIQTLGYHLHDLLRPPHAKEYRLDESATRTMKAAGEISDNLRKTVAIAKESTVQIRAELRRSEAAFSQLPEILDRVSDDLWINRTVGNLVKTSAEIFLEAVKEFNGKNDKRTIWSGSEDVVSDCLTAEILTKAFAPPRTVVEDLTPKFTFLRLGPDSLGALFSQDRFAAHHKLYGTRLFHFGAFLRKKWRKSDYLWGRLDAVHHLLPLLLGDYDQRQEEQLQNAILSSVSRHADRGSEKGKRFVVKHLVHLSRGKPGPLALLWNALGCIALMLLREPLRHTYRLWIWIKRRPILVALSLVTVAAFAVGFYFLE